MIGRELSPADGPGERRAIVMYYSFVRPRPVWLRALTALWGLWFAVALIEPAGIHQCPVHGVGAQMGDMGDMSAMDMGAKPMAAEMAKADQPPHHAASCTCLSLCYSSPAFVPPTAGAQLRDRVVAIAASQNFADSPCRVLERPHALPFANGPPVSM